MLNPANTRRIVSDRGLLYSPVSKFVEEADDETYFNIVMMAWHLNRDDQSTLAACNNLQINLLFLLLMTSSQSVAGGETNVLFNLFPLTTMCDIVRLSMVYS